MTGASLIALHIKKIVELCKTKSFSYFIKQCAIHQMRDLLNVILLTSVCSDLSEQKKREELPLNLSLRSGQTCKIYDFATSLEPAVSNLHSVTGKPEASRLKTLRMDFSVK